MDVQNLTFECGGLNIPGTIYKIYMVCKCDILTFPNLKTGSAKGDKITLDGDIVLKAGKVWKTIDIVSDTGKITHSAVGFTTAKCYENRLDFKLQKDKGSDEWFQNHINWSGVIIIKEKTGRYRVFGNDDDGARIEFAEGSSGAELFDEKSWISKIVDKTGRVVPYYDGEILTEIIGSFNTSFNFSFS